MRILWITNDVLEQFLAGVKKGNPTLGGSWIAPLFNSLGEYNSCEMGVITPVVKGEYKKTIVEKATFYSIPVKKDENWKRIRKATSKHYLCVIEDFKPDIIHFHGTERNFGLLRTVVTGEIPMVGSIQGIVNSILPYLYLATSGYNIKKFRSFKNWLGKGGTSILKYKWRVISYIERDIFSLNQYIIGRTLWDKAQAYSLNPKINYYHGEELLREAFYTKKWDVKRYEKYSIFISSGANPIKGLHTLIYAVSLLINKFPGLKVYVPLFKGDYKLRIKDYLLSDDYSIYIRSLIYKFKLENAIISLQRLDANQMAEQFSKSHVFVLSSFIENSPNALGEAMLVGTPTVVSYTGGVGSILENEKSTLFFPIGDYRTLAYQIERIFKNDELALKLSKNAQQIASIRHDNRKSTIQYIDIYKKIIEKHHEGTAHI